MAIGYFIRLGDKTSCGGKVVSATSRIIHHGLNLARLGDNDLPPGLDTTVS
jgi:uncharacterized Zn-binding protein involved in type VI secretion